MGVLVHDRTPGLMRWFTSPLAPGILPWSLRHRVPRIIDNELGTKGTVLRMLTDL